ncbi:MAG TPA: ribonuclease PH [Clostridiales bacterium]|nr:ribonuclease PH [Clostridiales bacterium]
MRPDGRGPDMLRPCCINRSVLKHPEGSALIVLGDTQVICTASVEERVPAFLRGSGRGWVTAEYGMLPRATAERQPRPGNAGRPSGRIYEIQRLIGRSLRAVVDRDRLGERTLWIDCDVLQADGGTRTAAVSAACVALAEALARLRSEGRIEQWPLRDLVAAVSAGVVNGQLLLDLAYLEDAGAAVDLNVVMTGGGRLVEIQGTGEAGPFEFGQLHELIALVRAGISGLLARQREALAGIPGLEAWLRGGG